MAESNRSPRNSTRIIKWIVFPAAVALIALANSRAGIAQSPSAPGASSPNAAVGTPAGEDPAVTFENLRRARHLTFAAPPSVVQAHRQWMAQNATAPTSASGSVPALAIGSNIDLPVSAYQGETAIAVNPGNANELVGAANSSFATTTPACVPPTGGNFGTQALYGSTDGGKTWATNCAPWPSSLNQGAGNVSFASDPAVAWDASSNAYAAYLLVSCTGANCSPSSDAIEVVKSTDSGATWASAGQVVNNLANTAIADDKELMAIDTNPASLHKGRIFVIWDQQTALAQPEMIAHSDNGGSIWTPVVIDTAAGAVDIGGDVAVGPGGIVYAVWNSLTFNASNVQTGESTMFSASVDGGTTWSTPGSVAAHFLLSFGNNSTIPAQDLRGINSFPAIAVDRSTSANVGRIYVAYTDYPSASAGADSNIYLVSSANQGVTWSGPLKVNDDSGTASQFFGWVDVDQSSGNLAMSWYDARNDPNNRHTQIFAAESTDGGAAFSANSLVSSPSAQFTNSTIDFSDENSTDNPNADANQYGDYAQIAFLNGIAHPLWCDSRNFFPSHTTNTLTEDGASAQVNFTASATPTPTATPTATATGTGGATPTPTPLPKLVLKPATTRKFPTQITLGGQGGTNSRAVTVSLNNPTSGKEAVAVQIESIQISGNGFGPFPGAPQNQCVGTLNPGKSCVVQMAFSPTQPGTSNGALTVTDNTTAGQHTVALIGTGKQGRIIYSPTAASFSAKLGSTSKPRTVTIRNRNPVPLAVNNPQPDNSDFLVSATNCLGSIPGGGFCTMKVSFKPSHTGTVKAHIVINDDAVGSPHKVNLTGTGTK